MKKEDFVKLGISEELAAKAETASQDELKGYIPKARFDEVNNEKKRLELDLRDRDGQLEALKNSTGDVEALKKQIADLQKANTEATEAHAKEIRQLQRDAVDTELLAGANAKNHKAVLALLEAVDDAVDLEGYKTERSKQVEAIKKSDAYLFEAMASAKIKGATPGQSGNDDGEKSMSKEQFRKMTPAERHSFSITNPTEYKQLYES